MCGSFLSSKWFDYIFEFKIQSFKFKLFKKFNFFEIQMEAIAAGSAGKDQKATLRIRDSCSQSVVLEWTEMD